MYVLSPWPWRLSYELNVVKENENETFSARTRAKLINKKKSSSINRRQKNEWKQDDGE